MPRVSRQTPVCLPKLKVSSTTACASAKALSTSPKSTSLSKQRLSPSSGWIKGVCSSSAVSISTTTGSSSYSILINATASSACARVSAITAQTASPCQHARSIAIACWGADLSPCRWVNTPVQGVQYSRSSAPVVIPSTPGVDAASSDLIDLIFAWA